MVSKKYAADYRLENVRDKQGKLRTVAVYRGTRYTFKASPQAVRRAARLYALLTAWSVLCFGVILFLNAAVLRQFYVLLPVLCCLLPLGYLTVAVIYTFTSTPPLTRERRDKICDRLAHTTVLLIFFSGVSLLGAGAAVALSLATTEWQTWVFFLAALGIFSASCVMYRKKGAFDVIPL
ncbi:MAG: hypothetical protein E7549_02530 [Ruminococcaceae bacterium]|nr:hypothetical protein [Oscillospiraceae bacterium]